MRSKSINGCARSAQLPYGSATESQSVKAETDSSTGEAPIHASTEINLGICLKSFKMKWLSFPLNLLGGVITLWKTGAHNRGQLDMCYIAACCHHQLQNRVMKRNEFSSMNSGYQVDTQLYN